jgi:hypothetical protein
MLEDVDDLLFPVDLCEEASPVVGWAFIPVEDHVRERFAIFSVELLLRKVQLSLNPSLFGKVCGMAGLVLVRQVFNVQLLEGLRTNLMACGL